MAATHKRPTEVSQLDFAGQHMSGSVWLWSAIGALPNVALLEKMDKHTPEQRHRNMAAVKAKGSKIEAILAKAMWNAGIRYRKNDKTVYGHPDFCMKGRRIAIFCDGEMWHGKDWELQKNEFKSNTEFWIPKIERNIARDKEVNAKLKADGWTVLRFWESAILKDLEQCLKIIKEFYNK